MCKIIFSLPNRNVHVNITLNVYNVSLLQRRHFNPIVSLPKFNDTSILLEVLRPILTVVSLMHMNVVLISVDKT